MVINPNGVRLGDVVDIVSDAFPRRAVYVALIGEDGTATGLPLEGDRDYVYFNTEDVTWAEGSGLELTLEAIEI